MTIEPTAASVASAPPPPRVRLPQFVGRRLPPRWGVQTGLVQPRMPAFWLFVVACVLGLLFALVLQVIELATSPVGWVLSWGLLVLYIVPVVLVVRWLDSYEPEPRSMLIGAFLWGFLVAPLFAILAELFWGVVITKVGGPEFSANWSAALTAPVIEEAYKYLGVIVLFLIARAEFDDLIDGFVYGALVGLGFAVAEDLGYFILNFGGSVPAVIDGFYLRVVLSGLYSHVTYTGIAGIGFAYFVTRRNEQPRSRRLVVAGGLLLLAMTAHFVWNSPLLAGLPDWLYTLSKGMPFLIGLLVLLWLARRRENEDLALVLSNESGKAGLTPSELDELRSWFRRRATRKEMGKAAGPVAQKLLTQLQREQLRLALVATAVDSPDDAGLIEQRARCQALRMQLWQVPGAAAALGLSQAKVDEARAAVPPPWSANALVTPTGAWALASPDWNDRRRIALPPGTPLQVIEQRDSWLLVRAVNGWLGWTDARYLSQT